MKNLFKIFIICLLSQSIFISYADDPREEMREAKSAFKRLMESAHPTPDNQYYGKEYWDMLQGSRLPYFLNINMTVDADNEPNKMQNESSIAYNPIDPTNLIGSAVDYRAESSTWVYVSKDGGHNWENKNLGKPFEGWQSTNDPSVAFDMDGTGYLVYGGFGKFDDNYNVMVGENGVFIAKSTDKGETWKAHIPIILHTGTQTLDSTFEDKYYIQVDNSPTSPYFKHLYVPWKRVTPRDSATQIVISKSTDKGETWSVPIPVSPRKSGSSEDTTYGQSFPLATTGPNGEVYVVWNDGIVHGVGFAKSMDGGITYTAPKIIFNYNIFGITKYLDGQGWRHSLKGKVRAETYPVIACDISNSPHRGNLYLTWAADSVPNIYFSKSTDKGESWSNPVIVHSVETNDQFWQWMAIDPTNGNIAIMYLDSRNDPANILFEAYVSFSNDGGNTWIDRPASDYAGDLRLNPFVGNSFAGDYSGCTFYDGIIYPSWVDMRNAESNIRDDDVYTSVINTRAPMPVENFAIKVLPEEPTKLQLNWDNPTKRSFGQSLSINEYQIVILRNNSQIAALDGGSNQFTDENLTPFEKYDYAIYVKAGRDSSVSRYNSSYPGGAKEPASPKILYSENIWQPSDGVKLQIQLPSKRADGQTPLIYMNKLILYRDSMEIQEIDVNPLDTSKTIEIEDLTPSNGYYRYFAKVMDSYNNSSSESNHYVAYAGKIIELNETDSFSENFDEKDLPKYYLAGNWGRTDEFAFTLPNSFTESPYGNYKNKEKDTFLLFPMHSANGILHIQFYNAAIVEPRDTAVIEYSIDNGITWSNQFLNSDSLNENVMYNYDNYSYWNDGELNEMDWRIENLYLTHLDSTILLRFRFASNVLKNDKGWFIDDLTISNRTLGVQDEVQNMHIYPNPVREYLNIYLGEVYNIPFEISIYDVVGSLILKKQYSSNADANIIIDVRNLQSGCYYINITSNKGILRAKLIKI
ncbi:MAG: T9SS type A sorting domain-containing protein [Chloroherpetonaceae bacterium]